MNDALIHDNDQTWTKAKQDIIVQLSDVNKGKTRHTCSTIYDVAKAKQDIIVQLSTMLHDIQLYLVSMFPITT